ncbi:hypothetical protein OEZ85_008953 [Tetradesmus obliquus]|uniref:Chalcone/stilbene synthase N-terminal domain-containing protein n=1 Tax=Tetradesmus obliquus TaxID=3088 RepID=A0ABY8TQ09_TETOB|nr:hypothetical protein OEZ85_008953 [Tetradesmus obliquus]
MACPTFKSGSEPLILGTGEAYPHHTYSQQEFLQALLERYPMDEASAAFARRIFPATGITAGSSALPRDQLFKRMTRSEFVTYIRDTTEDMSCRAAQQALAAWGGDLSSITHIVFGTMSAVIDAPTTDSRLINSMGLRPDIRRLSVQQMGCLTGFRCLSTAAELAAANPAARILVIVADVRSGLQNQLPHWESNNSGGPSRACIISCALFRDAASAVVIGAGARAGEVPLAKVLRSASAFLPGTLDYVHITDGDDATISWYNSKDLPYAVSAAAPDMVARLLKGVKGASISRTAFAMHPGGPKILQLTAKALGVTDDAFATSWGFLQQHGNTSGSSNLALLHRELMRAGTDASPRTRDIMCVGIGPGLALEGLLLRRVPPKQQQQQQQQGLGLVARQLAHVQQAWRRSSSSRVGRSRSWVTARVTPAGDDTGSCN